MEQDRPFRLAIRFGDFEADLSAGKIYRLGARVKLQKQPFQVLRTLLERPGDVITRAELRERIWTSDTFVDFECGLNKAINRIRGALSDSAENPMFIETVPGRGYRFVASVERPILSLAVLTLENLSGNSTQDYWAEGITDELISEITKIANLRIISRASADRFKASRKSLIQISRELGVDLVVQGSVAVSNRLIRIRVQLIDPFRDEHLWAESYEHELGDVVALQAQIAGAIADQIRARVVHQKAGLPLSTRRVNPEAYERYLKGRFFLSKRSDAEKSLEYFEKAIALDPRFAPAHAGLADSYVLLGVLYLRRPREVFPKARTFAEKALELDQTLAVGHRSMAVVRNLYDWDWEGSEGEFRRALALDPNLIGAHQGYSVLLSCLRRYEEATREILEARELDPLSLVINGLVGFIHMRARQYDRAIAECLKAIELDPNHPFGHWLLARSLDAANQAKDALVEAQVAAKLSGCRPPYSSHLGYAFARAGQLDAAKKVLAGLAERRKTEYVSPYDFAHIYIALGEAGLAFDWLDKSYEERTPQLSGELWEPIFDPLREHPRFSCLMRQIGLVPL